MASRLLDKNQGFRDAIFVVCEEYGCPLYNVGEEFIVSGAGMTIPPAKPVCMTMMQELINVTTGEKSVERFSSTGEHKNRFYCGGCKGDLFFELKRRKTFSTVQMQLLAAAEQRQKVQHVEQFYDLLKSLDIFTSLDDDNLLELAATLELKECAPQDMILQKGEPGAHLCIILEGNVIVQGDTGHTVSEMGVGEVFGEMSLLSGGSITNSVYSLGKSKLALLSSKNFRLMLSKHQVLQGFFYRLLVERAQTNVSCVGAISSGMQGRLEDIQPIELFQLLNSGRKTGQVNLVLADGNGQVLFNQGDLVQASFNDLEGKEAFFHLLKYGQGDFSFVSGLPQKSKNLPSLGGFMALVMEGLQMVDEEAA